MRAFLNSLLIVGGSNENWVEEDIPSRSLGRESDESNEASLSWYFSERR